jgi:hypothetical protein
MGLSVMQRLLVLLGPVAVIFGFPLLLIGVFGKGDNKSKNDAYWVYLGITFGVIIILAVAIGVINLLWAVVLWIIKNFIVIAIVLLSIFLLFALLGALTSTNYGSNREKTNWAITAFITAILLGILIIGKRGVFSMLKVGNITLMGVATLILIFLVISMIQALSDDYNKNGGF